jgi:hypothetical protein
MNNKIEILIIVSFYNPRKSGAAIKADGEVLMRCIKPLQS